jgi:hypothetical protein
LNPEYIIFKIGFKVLIPVVVNSSLHWDITPCNSLKVNDILEEYVVSIFRVEEHAKKETSVKHVLRKVCSESSGTSRWFLAFTMKMEATYSSETSADFKRIFRRYIPEILPALTVNMKIRNSHVCRNCEKEKRIRRAFGCRLENNIKTEIQEVGCECVGGFHLAHVSVHW